MIEKLRPLHPDPPRSPPSRATASTGLRALGLLSTTRSTSAGDCSPFLVVIAHAFEVDLRSSTILPQHVSRQALDLIW